MTEPNKICTGCGKGPEDKACFTLQCPRCKRLEHQSYFCGQPCFKKCWENHKAIHKELAQKVNNELMSMQGTSSFRQAVRSRLPTRFLECIYMTDPKMTWGYETLSKFNSQDESTYLTDPFLAQFKGYNFQGSLRPYPINRARKVPSSIPRPDYADSPLGESASEMEAQRNPKVITVCDEDTLNRLREAGVIGRRALDLCNTLAKVGTTTDHIDKQVHEFIVSQGAYPSPLNYYGFPKALCTSVNEVICHGIPDFRPLEDGDIVNCDITVFYKGVHADLNETFIVGTPNPRTLRIVQGAYDCLQAAIKAMKPKMMYREIGNHIHRKADELGLEVTRSYTGHGINTLFHCSPNVPHYRKNKCHGFLEPGHVFTVEPMINETTYKDRLWPDNWTAVTADGGLSAQFEHTFIVTNDGIETITARLPESPPLQIET